MHRCRQLNRESADKQYAAISMPQLAESNSRFSSIPGSPREIPKPTRSDGTKLGWHPETRSLTTTPAPLAGRPESCPAYFPSQPVQAGQSRPDCRRWGSPRRLGFPILLTASIRFGRRTTGQGSGHTFAVARGGWQCRGSEIALLQPAKAANRKTAQRNLVSQSPRRRTQTSSKVNSFFGNGRTFPENRGSRLFYR